MQFLRKLDKLTLSTYAGAPDNTEMNKLTRKTFLGSLLALFALIASTIKSKAENPLSKKTQNSRYYKEGNIGDGKHRYFRILTNFKQTSSIGIYSQTYKKMPFDFSIGFSDGICDIIIIFKTIPLKDEFRFKVGGFYNYDCDRIDLSEYAKLSMENQELIIKNTTDLNIKKGFSKKIEVEGLNPTWIHE